MAKNYSLKEAVEIINAGTDMESIADIGRRYPVLLHKVTKVCTQAGQDFVDLMSFMPEHLTANKVNTAIKNAFAEDSTEDAEDENTDNTEAEDEPKPRKAKKADIEEKDSNETDYESMSGKELFELLGKAGKRKDCKEKMGGLKKNHMVDYINKYGLESVSEDAEDEADTDEATEETNPYEGKTAMELFKECKKRGIKAEAKKKAKYYADLLIKADAEATEESDDDWGEEVEEPKEEKKASKKAAKKPAKEEPKEEDDDDDWDI
jgi:hypothetical protein